MHTYLQVRAGRRAGNQLFGDNDLFTNQMVPTEKTLVADRYDRSHKGLSSLPILRLPVSMYSIINALQFYATSNCNTIACTSVQKSDPRERGSLRYASSSQYVANM